MESTHAKRLRAGLRFQSWAREGASGDYIGTTPAANDDLPALIITLDISAKNGCSLRIIIFLKGEGTLNH